MNGAVAVESSGAVHLEICVGTLEACLRDAHFIVPVGKLNRSFIFERDEKITKGDVREVSVDFNRLGLAKRTAEREVAIHNALRGEIFQVQAAGKQGVEIEFHNRKLAGDRLIARQAQRNLAAELTVRSFGIESQANVFAVGCEPAAKVSLIVSADF